MPCARAPRAACGVLHLRVPRAACGVLCLRLPRGQWAGLCVCARAAGGAGQARRLYALCSLLRPEPRGACGARGRALRAACPRLGTWGGSPFYPRTSGAFLASRSCRTACSCRQREGRCASLLGVRGRAVCASRPPLCAEPPRAPGWRAAGARCVQSLRERQAGGPQGRAAALVNGGAEPTAGRRSGRDVAAGALRKGAPSGHVLGPDVGTCGPRRTQERPCTMRGACAQLPAREAGPCANVQTEETKKERCSEVSLAAYDLF